MFEQVIERVPRPGARADSNIPAAATFGSLRAVEPAEPHAQRANTTGTPTP